MATKPPDPDGKIGRPGPGHFYLLLVGINDYPHLNSLKGCIADVDAIENFIKNDHYKFKINTDQNAPDKPGVRNEINIDGEVEPLVYHSYNIPRNDMGSLNICRLTEEKATRQGVINGFKKFLTLAQENDSVWFHYSGHGAESPTAAEFSNLENGKDNCMLLWDYEVDAAGNARGMLADKELAQLLNEVTGDGIFHLLVTLDCCNSGTGTRGDEVNRIDEKWGNRGQDLPKEFTGRDITSYYGYSAENRAYVPPPSHVVLTACTDLQFAGDADEGGAFTSGLINALKTANNGLINYADLYTRTRFSVGRMNAQQTPQFDVIGNTQAYTLFLDGISDGDPDQYPVHFEPGKGWVVHCGVIHHLPEQSQLPIWFNLYSGSNTETPLLTTQIVSVGPQYSTFALPEDTTTEGETFVLPDGKILDVNDHTLYAVFSQIPAPKEMVRISGRDRAGIKALKDAWTEKAKALNIHFLEAGDDTPFTLRVKSDNGAYVLRDLELKQDTPVNYTTDKPEEVVADLITITKWRRTRALHKDRSRLKGKIQLDFRVTGADDQTVALRENNGRLILRASQSTMMPLTKPGWRVYEVHPEVSISGVDTDLHCYLLELYENNYKVKMYSVPKPFQHLHSSGTIAYESKKIGLSADSDNFTYHFKLLVTTSPLDYFQLLQEGIPGDRFEAEQTEDPNQGFEDWWVIDKVLKVVRRD